LFRVQGSGFRVIGLGLRVLGCMFRVWGSSSGGLRRSQKVSEGLRRSQKVSCKGLGFVVQGLGLRGRVGGSGFRVQGVGIGVGV
jgi:hypothetical protein